MQAVENWDLKIKILNKFYVKENCLNNFKWQFLQIKLFKKEKLNAKYKIIKMSINKQIQFKKKKKLNFMSFNQLILNEYSKFSHKHLCIF